MANDWFDENAPRTVGGPGGPFLTEKGNPLSASEQRRLDAAVGILPNNEPSAVQTTGLTPSLVRNPEQDPRWTGPPLPKNQWGSDPLGQPQVYDPNSPQYQAYVREYNDAMARNPWATAVNPTTGQTGVTATAPTPDSSGPRYTEMPGSAAYRGTTTGGASDIGTAPKPGLIPAAQWTGATANGLPLDLTGEYIWDATVGAMRRKTGTDRVWDAAANDWKAAGTGTGATVSTATTTGGTTQTNANDAITRAMQIGANGNPTYWQNVSTEDFGSLLQPWSQQFSYEAFQSPEPFVAGTLKTPADMAANPNATAGKPDWSTDPGYDFRLREGQKALERSAAAKGTLLNGGTLKALNDYSQNVASDEYNRIYGRKYGEYSDQYNRSKSDYTTGYNKALGEYQTAFNVFGSNQANLYNRLAGLSGLGQTSANQLASTGLGYSQINANLASNQAGNYGNLVTGQANAAAAGVIGSQNAWTNYGNQLSNLASSYDWSKVKW